jgi:hypothetical protein
MCDVRVAVGKGFVLISVCEARVGIKLITTSSQQTASNIPDIAVFIQSPSSWKLPFHIPTHWLDSRLSLSRSLSLIQRQIASCSVSSSRRYRGMICRTPHVLRNLQVRPFHFPKNKLTRPHAQSTQDFAQSPTFSLHYTAHGPLISRLKLTLPPPSKARRFHTRPIY